MKMCVIDAANKIVNIVEVDEDADWEPPEGHTVRPWAKGDEYQQTPEQKLAAEAAAYIASLDAKAKAYLGGDATKALTPLETQKLLCYLALRR